MVQTVLRIEDLRVYYYTLRGIVYAVDGVSLEANSGDMVAIVGESGSGKSTLGLAVIGMVLPPGRIVSGRIVVDGIDITSLRGEELRRARGRLVSIVFQNPFTTLDPVRRVGDQLVEVLVEHGVDKKEAWAIAKRVFKSVGLGENLLKAYPHQLSGGQRQRVAIAMAIALNPRVLVADEPTTALDVIVQKQVMELLDEIRRRGTLILLITHDIALAATWATRIAVMYAGKIVEYAPTEELVKNPLHPYTRGLINATPSLDRSDRPKSIPGLPPDLRRPPPGCRFAPRCPLATSRCRSEEPPTTKISQNHYVKCWEYGG